MRLRIKGYIPKVKKRFSRKMKKEENFLIKVYRSIISENIRRNANEKIDDNTKTGKSWNESTLEVKI